MAKAIFPGTFDPPTYGHLNIIERGAKLFDSLEVLIAVNSRKKPFLPPDEKRRLLEAEIMRMGLENVKVNTYEGLVVEYCRQADARVLLRGVRTSGDFDYELELSILNKQLSGDVETVMLPTEPRFLVLRSSSIKELLGLGGDISEMVPPGVEESLKRYSS